MDLETKLRETLQRGVKAERELEIIEPRLAALKISCHDQWEQSKDADADAEIKRLLRSINMLERLFKREINAGKQAKQKLGEE